ncbi:MAG: flagellar protein FlgN [Gammaproteobacteria bacterium]|nr:MAG: flagellar protein FlgN [Gammaproteobacteria bacterium]
MDATTLKGPFRATLEASLAELERLSEILKAERKALLGPDVSALEQVVLEKNRCLETLEHSVKAREQMLAQLGLPGGLGGAEQFLSAHFSRDELLVQWKRLVELSREVAELNVHNGKLAMASERRAREALSILTGRPLIPETYSAKRGLTNSTGITLGRC